MRDKPTPGDRAIEVLLRQYIADGLNGPQMVKLIPGKTLSSIHGSCYRLGLTIGKRGPRPKKPSKKRLPRRLHASVKLDQAIPARTLRHPFEPRCTWHLCGAIPVKGKPYCSQHRQFMCIDPAHPGDPHVSSR